MWLHCLKLLVETPGVAARGCSGNMDACRDRGVCCQTRTACDTFYADFYEIVRISLNIRGIRRYPGSEVCSAASDIFKRPVDLFTLVLAPLIFKLPGILFTVWPHRQNDVTFIDTRLIGLCSLFRNPRSHQSTDDASANTTCTSTSQTSCKRTSDDEAQARYRNTGSDGCQYTCGSPQSTTNCRSRTRSFQSFVAHFTLPFTPVVEVLFTGLFGHDDVDLVGLIVTIQCRLVGIFSTFTISEQCREDTRPVAASG